MRIRRYSLGSRLLLSITWKSPEGLCAVMLCCVMSTATAAASARREAVLWLPRQPGENRPGYNSYRVWRLLPTSELSAYLSWAQRTVRAVWTEENWHPEQDQQYRWERDFLLQPFVVFYFFIIWMYYLFKNQTNIIHFFWTETALLLFFSTKEFVPFI